MNVLKSFIRPDDLESFILKEYPIESKDFMGQRMIKCELIKATMRDVYLVRAYNSEKPRFVACLYNANVSSAQIRAELEFIKILAEANIPTAMFVRRHDTDWICSIVMPEGKRNLVLFEYVYGTPLGRGASLNHIEAYGTTLAKTHRIADSISHKLLCPHQSIGSLLIEPQKFIIEHLRKIKLVDELFKAEKIVRIGLDLLPKDSPAFGLIHGDVIPSNAIISADSTLHIIDFDCAAYGWRMYDVATFLNEIAYWQMGDDAEAAFIKGYESIRPISQAERESIPLLGAARNIWEIGNAARHVNTWGSHLYLSERVLDGIMQNLRRNIAKLGF